MANSNEQTVFHPCICAEEISSECSEQWIMCMEDGGELSSVMVLIGMDGGGGGGGLGNRPCGFGSRIILALVKLFLQVLSFRFLFV